PWTADTADAGASPWTAPGSPPSSARRCASWGWSARSRTSPTCRAISSSRTGREPSPPDALAIARPAHWTAPAAGSSSSGAAAAVWFMTHGVWPRGRLYRRCDGGVRCLKPEHHRQGRAPVRQPELRAGRPLRFDEAAVRDIRRRRAAGETYRSLSEHYGASI